MPFDIDLEESHRFRDGSSFQIFGESDAWHPFTLLCCQSLPHLVQSAVLLTFDDQFSRVRRDRSLMRFKVARLEGSEGCVEFQKPEGVGHGFKGNHSARGTGCRRHHHGKITNVGTDIDADITSGY